MTSTSPGGRTRAGGPVRSRRLLGDRSPVVVEASPPALVVELSEVAARVGAAVGVVGPAQPEGDAAGDDDGAHRHPRDRGDTGVAGQEVADAAQHHSDADRRSGGHGGGAEVGGRDATEQQRGEDGAEVGVDLGELEVDRHARAALVEVVLDLRRVARDDAAADVGAELAVGPPAGVLVELRGVLGQERLAQSLAGAVGERGDRVGAHPEHRRDVGGLLALDLGVPQHELPALGQRRERRGGGGALEALDGRVAERHARVEGLHVVGRVQPGPGPDPVDVEPAYRGEQVGAEGEVGAAAALEHPQHLDERLGHEVVGVARAGRAGARAGGRRPRGARRACRRRRGPRRGPPRSARRRWAPRRWWSRSWLDAHGWTLPGTPPDGRRPSDCIPAGASTAPESEETRNVGQVRVMGRHEHRHIHRAWLELGQSMTWGTREGVCREDLRHAGASTRGCRSRGERAGAHRRAVGVAAPVRGCRRSAHLGIGRHRRLRRRGPGAGPRRGVRSRRRSPGCAPRGGG